MIEAVCIKDFHMKDDGSLCFKKNKIYYFDFTDLYGCFVVAERSERPAPHYLPKSMFFQHFVTGNKGIQVLYG